EEEEEEEEEEKPRREEQHKSKTINEEEDTMSAKDISDGGRNNQVGRKKLRLTKEQLTLLENSFREHNTLNQTQKQQLAGQLKLRPRQVEVWFQNRRARYTNISIINLCFPSVAILISIPLSTHRCKLCRRFDGFGFHACRTKLKQTEVDCEFLRKYCENLRIENRRLKRELEELRAMEPGCPFHIRVPKAATVTMCPSCKRIGEKGNGALDTMKGWPSGSCK
ncbi:putative Homeobox-leucine zipper protein HOX19, partial [Cocos nucifera]